MTWVNTSAWREVLARVFDGFVVEYDVMPEWLVNPETNRRLKLDVLYPEIGVAIRFWGLRGKERRQHLSLEEEDQQKARDTAREILCEAHGVTLVPIDVVAGEPKAILREMERALSKASRLLAKSNLSDTRKGRLVEQASKARSRLSDIARRVRHPEDLSLYADLWRDRQYAEIPQSEAASTNGSSFAYKPGMHVHHVVFGDGVVQAVQPDGDDSLVTIHFADNTQKTFAASLVGDKMSPRSAGS
jgi:hypothetical protein